MGNTLTLQDDKFKELWDRLSPNNSGNFRVPPKYLVMHYTAGTSATGARDWLCNPNARGKPSAHLVVGDTEDTTFQIVPFDRIAHHAGKSFYKGVSYLNDDSIGIEVVNAGPLTQGVDRKWRTWYGAVIPEERVLVAPHKRGGPVRGWMSYSPEQMEWLEIITQTILAHYPSIKEVVGHDDISWPRKTDPGPAFPMSKFQALTDPRSARPKETKPEDFTKDQITADDDLFEVTARVLNIRGGPGTSFEKISAYGPLKDGQLLEVLEEEGDGWVFVELVGGEHPGNRGYVYDKYIKRT